MALPDLSDYLSQRSGVGEGRGGGGSRSILMIRKELVLTEWDSHSWRGACLPLLRTDLAGALWLHHVLTDTGTVFVFQFSV